MSLSEKKGEVNRKLFLKKKKNTHKQEASYTMKFKFNL